MVYKHQHFHDMAKRDFTTIDGQVVSVVFVTAEPTFTGVIGGYATSDDSSPTATDSENQDASPTDAAGSPSSDPFSYNLSEIYPSTSTSDVQSAATSAAVASNDLTATSSSGSYSYGTSTRQVSATGATSADSNTSNASTSTTSSSSDGGMSTAGKAGLAIGIILAIGAVLALLLFLLGKKKKQVKAEQARQDSEKSAAIAAANAPLAHPPRLSLRPASSFLPEFMGGSRPKSRLSQGTMLAAPSSEPNPMKEKYLAASAPQNIPMTEKNAPVENPFRDPENPFADPVKPAPEPVRMPEPIAQAAPLRMPMSLEAPQATQVAMPEPSGSSSDKIATAAASAGAVAAARAAMRNDERSVRREPTRPEPIEMPSPPVHVPAPLSTPKSMVSNASSAPSGTADGQVYRILMDFVPSMEDELELKGGQVVRMLHEYDDGWCLCTRLDRSQQGVVPRTCLAAKPSKPRPGPGPNQQRPMSPAMGPPHGHAMSPAMRNGPPRPMSPGQGRPMSPGMGNRAMSPGPRGRAPMGVQGRPMSPARNGQPHGTRSMSPGAYNQAPRPLSPGPRSSQNSRRAQSPGPYGHAGGPKPMAPSQRRRSNSSSAAARDVRDRRASPPGPSPLGGFAPGMAI